VNSDKEGWFDIKRYIAFFCYSDGVNIGWKGKNSHGICRSVEEFKCFGKKLKI